MCAGTRHNGKRPARIRDAGHGQKGLREAWRAAVLTSGDVRLESSVLIVVFGRLEVSVVETDTCPVTDRPRTTSTLHHR